MDWLRELWGRLMDELVAHDETLYGVLTDVIRENAFYLLAGSIPLFSAIVRSFGVTVRTGQTGLLFRFGRVIKTIPPGFRLLIPFLEVVRKVPTRSRTLDLPAQRLVTREGLVFDVDATLVYRIVDIEKALVEVDDLELGMLNLLVLGVQRVLREASMRELREGSGLDQRLAAHLQVQLSDWGVEVQRVGLPSIAPSIETLRLTQVRATTGKRGDLLNTLTEGGVRSPVALGLVGTRQRALPKTRILRRQDRANRSRARTTARLLRSGYNSVEIRRAMTSP